MTRRAHGSETAPARGGAWRPLLRFWAVVGIGLAAGAGVLQVLGPPPRRVAETPPPPAAAPAPVAPTLTPATPVATPIAAPAARRATQPGAPLPAPDPALQEPAPGLDGAMLPRIAPDGRMAMQVFAAPFDAAAPRPKVAILLAGIGMALVDSEAAIRTTPPAISLAFSPYTPRPARLVGLARETGHETLISLPMEPLGYPLNDAGNRALLTGASLAQNDERLVWALSRISGYVGATAAMSGLRGERFAGSERMEQVLDTLAGRGLLYIDPRPPPVQRAAAPPARPGGRTVDVLVDESPVRSEIEAQLARLEQLARDRGAALGLAGQPMPVTVDRLTAWAATLGNRGIALVPVSALVPPLPGKSDAAAETHPGNRAGSR